MTRVKTSLIAIALISSTAAIGAPTAFAGDGAAPVGPRAPLGLLTTPSKTSGSARAQPVTTSHSSGHHRNRVCWKHRHHWHCW